MVDLDKKPDYIENIEKANYYFRYKTLAEGGKFSEALELNQKAYEFFYEMYLNEKKDRKFKLKIKRVLEKIAGDGSFIQIQLNKPEEKA